MFCWLCGKNGTNVGDGPTRTASIQAASGDFVRIKEECPGKSLPEAIEWVTRMAK